MIKIPKAPQVCAVLALTMTACEYIGPQLHEKMPLPQAKPIQDDYYAYEDTEAANTKTAKVELFPNTESTINASKGLTASPKGTGKGEFSLNFDDADLGEVAKVILSDILAKNYTISPQVTGKVTLQTTQPLSKDDLIPTLEMLLSVNNAALVIENGMYLIKPSNEAMYGSSFKSIGSSSLPSGYQTRVIPIHNVAATEIAEILKPLLPEKSLIHADPHRNILLVSGSGSELNRIMDVVRTFDIDVLRGRSFALFTPAHVDAGKIIEELDQIFSRKSAGGEKSEENTFFRFIEIERMNAVLAITHNARYLQDIESWVMRLDRTNPEASGGVNVYRAQHVSAMDLADTLSNIFGTGTGRSSRSASIASGRNSTSASNKSSGSSSSASSMNGGGSSSSIGGASGGGSNVLDKKIGDRNQDRSSGGSSLLGNNSLGGSGGQNSNSEMAKVKIIPDEGNNALIIVANSEEYEKIRRVIKELDVLPLQVLIDATIVEVTLNDDLKYGLQWYFSHNNGGSNDILGGSGQGMDISELARDAARAFSTGGFSYAFSANSGDIKAVLNASATNNNINVISSPSLMVLNNQEATIKVGDSVPIRSSVSTNLTSGGANNTPIQTSSIQMIDTGVNLSVRPRVNAGGLVLMDILQSVNQAIKTTTSETIDSPTIQKREIESSVAVQSGETIVLGGLIKENNDYLRDGVPFLHEIPLIGPLFGGTTRNKDKSELVVLLTPRVVSSRQGAQSITDEFRRKLSSIYQLPEEKQLEKIRE